MKTLRSKFVFWICILFVLIGVLIFVPLSRLLPEKITAQILKRDIRIAHYLSREVQELLLVDNKLALKLLLKDRLESLPDGIYIFIRGRHKEIISSTFKDGFPKALIDINPIDNLPQEGHSISKFLVSGKKVYDIAIPLLEGELGTLHIGVSLEASRTEIAEFSRINYYVAVVIFIGLSIGIIIFAFLGIFLSNRIIKLRDFATAIGKGNLNERIDIKTKDEIGSLAASFNKMAENLKEKIETIRKLSFLEERDRIALEFHDGIAQNLADIIKRLELCERLFKINPDKAFAELDLLKKNTGDVLKKTRQVISDLKLPQDTEFDLLRNLDDYIKDFQKQNDMYVKFDVASSFDGIALEDARSIFYIIKETLTNISKHAQARNVQLSLGRDASHELDIFVKDDGRGFDVAEAESSASVHGRWGIIGMRKRAASLGGSLSINSMLDKGTEVHIKIPLGLKEGMFGCQIG